MRHVWLLLLILAASCVAQARSVPSRKTPQTAKHLKTLDQAVLQATQNGDLTALKAALKRGANINARSKNGQTPLMLTVRQGNISLVKLMLDKGAKVNLQDQSGRTALSHVAAQNFTTIVKLLQSHGARASEGDSALLLGEALMGDPAQIKRLVAIGVDREIRDRDGRTAVSILALYGAKDDFPQEEPQRAYALKLLLDGGANPDASDSDNEGMTALMWAAYTGRISMVRLLLAAGAKPDARNKMGQTALHSAAQNTAEAEGLAVATVLLAKGANVNATDHYGGTALMIAAKDGRLSLLRLLLNNHANVNASDARGMTPLMEAAAFGGAPIVEELIRRGADVNAKDKSGKTVLQVLRAAPFEYNSGANFSQEVLKEQLEKGLAQAQARRDAACVLLLKAGAKE